MDLPVGYFQFHKDTFINYQLNRWYSLGFTRKEEIEEVGRRTKTFEDYVSAFVGLAEKASAQDRLKNAAFYYRAAEFLLEPGDANKLTLYETFRRLFYRAFAADAIEQHEIPYAGRHIPAMRLPARSGQTKGTVLAFGGFDSFIEEFYAIWAGLAEGGYEVIAFEGPGQGAALRQYGLPFDHDWEKPTGAVLDHFGLSNVALVGLSMGGYWAIRAAAFDKRIARVIAAPPVYDWMEMTHPINRRLAHALVKRRGLMNVLVRLKMANSKLRHTVNHALFITQQDEPVDAVHWMLGMNKEHLHSARVEQDVLLMGGENDAFQPPVLIEKQKEALTNARSVTTRIFTAAEHADQHCQIGNLGLAVQTMVGWLDEKSKERVQMNDQ